MDSSHEVPSVVTSIPVPISKRGLLTREESRQELIDNLTKASAWIDEHGQPGTFGDAYWLPPEKSLTDSPLDYYIHWVQIIRLTELQKRGPWFLGDMLNNMERVWGETYAQVAEATGHSVNTLYRYSWVCRSIPWHVRRNPDLVSFSTHVPIANRIYSEEEQQEWLQTCAEKRWTGEQFAEKLKAGKEREVWQDDGRPAQVSDEGRALPAPEQANSIPGNRNSGKEEQEVEALGENPAPAVARYVSGTEICCPHCGSIFKLPEWAD